MLLFTIFYLLSIIIYFYLNNFIASLLLIALAIFLSTNEYKKNMKINSMLFLYLGFLLPFGISLLKLSNLSSVYSIKLFLLIYITIFIFYLFNKTDIFDFIHIKKDIKLYDNLDKSIDSIYAILLFTFLISFISLIIEIIVLRYLPLFTLKTPHAYSSFHIFGIHYLTVFAKFLPVFSTVLIFQCNYSFRELFISNNKYKIMIIIGYLYPLILSLLLVSRSILFYSIFYTIVYVLIVNQNVFNNVKIKYKFLFVLFFIVVYVVISIFRAHNIEYLNSIFNMKYNLPIFISQPYMYLAHNFENLNYLIDKLDIFTLGKRCLNSIWTLTLIKKFFTLNIYTIPYIIKEELSTCTFLYDIYYDFSIYGVAIFVFIIAKIYKYFELIICKLNTNYVLKMNPFFIIIYDILLSYIFFSFFQNYYLLTNSVIDIIYLYILMHIFDYCVSL